MIMINFVYGFIWVSSVISIVVLYNNIYNPGFVTIMSTLLQGIFSIIYNRKLPNVSRQDIVTIFILAGYIYTSNVSLLYMSIYNFALFKNISPMITQLILGIFKIENLKFYQIILNITSVIGLNLAYNGSIDTNILALVFGILMIVFNSLKYIFAKKSLQTRTPITMICDFNLFIGILLIPLIITENKLPNVHSILHIVLGFILGLLINFSQWSLLNNVSINTMTFFEISKMFILLVIGIFTQKRNLQMLNYMGLFIVSFSVILFYSIKTSISLR